MITINKIQTSPPNSNLLELFRLFLQNVQFYELCMSFCIVVREKVFWFLGIVQFYRKPSRTMQTQDSPGNLKRRSRSENQKRESCTCLHLICTENCTFCAPKARLGSDVENSLNSLHYRCEAWPTPNVQSQNFGWTLHRRREQFFLQRNVLSDLSAVVDTPTQETEYYQPIKINIDDSILSKHSKYVRLVGERGSQKSSRITNKKTSLVACGPILFELEFCPNWKSRPRFCFSDHKKDSFSEIFLQTEFEVPRQRGHQRESTTSISGSKKLHPKGKILRTPILFFLLLCSVFNFGQRQSIVASRPSSFWAIFLKQKR